VDSDTYKRKLCRVWLDSCGHYCHFGAKCTYAHGVEELRLLADAAAGAGHAHAQVAATFAASARGGEPPASPLLPGAGGGARAYAGTPPPHHSTPRPASVASSGVATVVGAASASAQATPDRLLSDADAFFPSAPPSPAALARAPGGAGAGTAATASPSPPPLSLFALGLPADDSPHGGVMSSNSPRIAASAFHAVGGGGDALFAAPLKPVAEPAPPLPPGAVKAAPPLQHAGGAAAAAGALARLAVADAGGGAGGDDDAALRGGGAGGASARLRAPSGAAGAAGAGMTAAAASAAARRPLLRHYLCGRWLEKLVKVLAASAAMLAGEVDVTALLTDMSNWCEGGASGACDAAHGIHEMQLPSREQLDAMLRELFYVGFIPDGGFVIPSGPQQGSVAMQPRGGAGAGGAGGAGAGAGGAGSGWRGAGGGGRMQLSPGDGGSGAFDVDGGGGRPSGGMLSGTAGAALGAEVTPAPPAPDMSVGRQDQIMLLIASGIVTPLMPAWLQNSVRGVSQTARGRGPAAVSAVTFPNLDEVYARLTAQGMPAPLARASASAAHNPLMRHILATAAQLDTSNRPVDLSRLVSVVGKVACNAAIAVAAVSTGLFVLPANGPPQLPQGPF
jgi:hypothetical protein